MTKEKRNHNLYLRPKFIEIIKQAEFIQVTNHKWIKFNHQGEFIEFLIQYCLDENIITLNKENEMEYFNSLPEQHSSWSN